MNNILAKCSSNCKQRQHSMTASQQEFQSKATLVHLISAHSLQVERIQRQCWKHSLQTATLMQLNLQSKSSAQMKTELLLLTQKATTFQWQASTSTMVTSISTQQASTRCQHLTSRFPTSSNSQWISLQTKKSARSLVDSSVAKQKLHLKMKKEMQSFHSSIQTHSHKLSSARHSFHLSSQH